jgi:competence protein ComEA
MHEAFEPPPRPVARRRVDDAARAWLAWFGAGRLVAAALSVVVVVAGGVWLLREPTPSTEAALPAATNTSGSPVATLSPPVTATTEPSPATTPAAVVVHVAGAVAVPGVYTLAGGSRVADAITAAGGAAPDAELDAVNLASRVADGQRIYVPHAGEVDPASLPSLGGAAGSSLPVGPVDLNTATAEQLDQLPGIGPATAAAIVDDRQRNGPYATVADLDRVPGIGAAKLAALVDQVTV